LTDTENIKNMFSSETIVELNIYPNMIKDFSLSKISIVKFYVGNGGKVNEIEIVKSLVRPFNDAIFNG
tara:strand:+ start:241 stop:444 length:204 start_codon:yes stop_codon:yes gene_type:complete